MQPAQIGAYSIERVLGRGGFGVVYVGLDARLDRRVAIKQLLPQMSDRRDLVERFFNEARAAAAIDHPGIIEIYDVGWHTDGSAYFTMKLLDGEPLGRRVAAGALGVDFAVAIARQVASALGAAHARGIVHRDLKPDNIMLVRDDEAAIRERAVVLDFGIAKLARELTDPLNVTATGAVMGTPLYMSPEQCRGAGDVDHRTDIYALGCVLYQMLAGRAPFLGAAAGEVLGMHQFVAPPPLPPTVPRALSVLVEQMLAKQPADRPQQMTDVITALQAATSRAPKPPARGLRWWIAGGLAVVTATVVVVVALRPSRDTPAPPPAPPPSRLVMPTLPSPTAWTPSVTAEDLDDGTRLAIAQAMSALQRNSLRDARAQIDKLERRGIARESQIYVSLMQMYAQTEQQLRDHYTKQMRAKLPDCAAQDALYAELEQSQGTAFAELVRAAAPCAR